jgi:hypothetical protein
MGSHPKVAAVGEESDELPETRGLMTRLESKRREGHIPKGGKCC